MTNTSQYTGFLLLLLSLYTGLLPLLLLLLLLLVAGATGNGCSEHWAALKQVGDVMSGF